MDRARSLFRGVFYRYNSQLTVQTVSNMLFVELGAEHLDLNHVNKLVESYRSLSASDLGISSNKLNSLPSTKQNLSVSEKPTIAVVSPDLRNHPVGRFWLPVAKVLHRKFKVIHVSLNPGLEDPIRSQLRISSHSWHDVDNRDNPLTLLKTISPDCILDLAGHTADNRPSLYNFRIAPLQLTYLGFYGPSYGSECDWWILDESIARRLTNSYPGSEPIWKLPCPSLCYDPELHGLPSPDLVNYSNPISPTFGSFNHTRKLTSDCLLNFQQILSCWPILLLFHSHSFYDPQVAVGFL